MGCCGEKAFFIWVKVLSVICLVLGIVQFSYAVQAFKVATNAPWGAWWAGVSLVLFSIVFFFAKKKDGCCSVGLSMGFAIPSVSLLLAGAILDGVSYAFVDELQACANTDGKVYGNNNYASAALGCVISNKDYDCSCVQDNFKTTDDDTVDCYLFDMAGDSIDCQPILNLPPPLQGSYTFCIVGLIIGLALAIMACSAVCCPVQANGDSYDAPLVAGEPAPAIVTHPNGPAQGVVIQQSPIAAVPASDIKPMV